MSETVSVVPHDATYDRLESTDSGIFFELGEAFTFFAPNYKFHPAYKMKRWNGKIALFNPFKKLFPVGLRGELQKFCASRGFNFELKVDETNSSFTEEDAKAFVASLGLPTELNGVPFEVRDYQLDAFLKAVQTGRLVLLSPTASGKSLIIYLMLKYYQKKTLVIVPTLGLVSQMTGDLIEYGMKADDIHQIFSGQEKMTDHLITISTWQSLQKMSGNYLGRYEVLIVDECHGAKSVQVKGIVERMTNTHIRIGTTGTLDNEKLNQLTIQGLFGPTYKVTTTRELIDSKRLADFKIECILLEHPEEARKDLVKMKYPDEMKYLVFNEDRNRFIVNLAKSLKGNTLILFQFVEHHGEPLYETIKEKFDWPVLFVSGKVPADEREVIRKFVNGATQSTTIASKGTFSTGTNIPNIDNIIFASPSKARIQTLQSIGRGLRRSDRKSACVLYDIADDISYKKWQNHTLNHFTERVKIYNQEQFDYQLHQVKL
jgi:superfamily II DNA or RNA helicase